MRAPLAKSLYGYLWLWLFTIFVPVVVVFLHGTHEMQQLSDSSRQLVRDSAKATGLLQRLFKEQLVFQHSAQVYQVLGADSALATFNTTDASLTAIISELRGLLRSEADRGALERFVTLQRSIGARMRTPTMPGSESAVGGGRPAVPDFAVFDDQGSRIAAMVQAQIDTELAALSDQNRSAKKELLLELGMVGPLALLVTFSLVFGVGRPLRQVDRAITELGGGNFTHEISVSGPDDLRRLGEQLEWLRRRLLDVAQERNRFLRHMSHELKTPLANIREGTELLMDGAVGALDAGQREVTAILQDNGIKLQRMIENLLSFSAWQSSSIGVDPVEFRIRPVVKQVLENQQLTLVAQRLRLDVKIEDLVLFADRGKLRLILENLLSNAIKYSPRGGMITVRAHASAADLVLEVADDGAGIPLAERASVFEAFHTGRAPGGHVRGTGIGLSVVHEFVQAHHGTIEIVDGEFRGAHFRISMPLRIESQPLGDVTAAAAPTATRKAHAA